jgi:hypothetical protein
MATSFKGWLSSWGDSWGTVTVDPNAMYGAVTFTFTATGILSNGGTITTRLKYWDGSTWQPKTLQYFDGSLWTTKTLKAWNGSTWI